VNLSRNFGQQAAICAGLHVCRGERVLIIDADLQDPPELLAEMMRIMDEGADVVYGRRASRTGEPAWKLLTAALFYRMLRWLTDAEQPLDAGDFRLLSRRVVELVLQTGCKLPYVRGMTASLGFSQVAVEYDRRPRTAGESHYSVSKLGHLALSGVLTSSLKPLYLPFFAAAVCWIVAGVLCAIGIVRSFDPEPDIAWILAGGVVAAVFGLIFVCLGVLGVYIGAVYRQFAGPPLFVIDAVRRRAQSTPEAANAPVCDVASLRQNIDRFEATQSARAEILDGGGEYL
jgi:dolichol-phosphate mannosyltransferase